MRLLAAAALMMTLLVLTDAVPAQKMKADTPEGTALKGRLPNYYGKVGLDDEQRQRIYGIQAEYRDKIQNLLQEVEDLRTEEALTIQAVLTDEQRAELNKMITEARKKRADSRE